MQCLYKCLTSDWNFCFKIMNFTISMFEFSTEQLYDISFKIFIVCMKKKSIYILGCLFDGKMYSAGEQIIFGGCLGAMTCMGDNLYANLKQYG